MTEVVLDEHSSEPLHAQLRRIFLDKIQTQRWKPGDRISPETSLSEDYGVSRSTVRQAVLSLVHEGYLTRKQGRGTFVVPQKTDFSILDFRFSLPTDAIHQLLDITGDHKNPSAAERLGGSALEPLTRLRRVRLANGEPVAMETSLLLNRSFPDLIQSDLQLPLWDILQNDYTITITHYSTAIEPVILTAHERDTLNCPDHPTAGLLVTRHGYVSASDRVPIVLSKSVFRGDTCRAIFTTDSDGS